MSWLEFLFQEYKESYLSWLIGFYEVLDMMEVHASRISILIGSSYPLSVVWYD